MGRILLAIGFWALAICLAASHYALGVAVPLGVLLASFGLKFFHAGVSVPTFLIIVAVLWGIGVLETLIEGVWLFTRDRVEQAVARWTVTVSMIGLATTFVVAVENAQRSWDYISNGTDAAANAS